MRNPHASPSFESPVGLPNALERARRVLIVRRLPIFASCWLVTMLVWMGVMYWERLVTISQASVLLFFQTSALVLTMLAGRRGH